MTGSVEDAAGPSRPKAYHRTQLALSLSSTAAGWAYLLLLVLTPLSAWLAAATKLTANPYLHFVLFGLAAGVLAQVYALPLSFLSGYLVEHRYQLSNQSLAGWAWERTKGALVGAAVGLPLALVFLACLRAFGAGWWLPVGGVLILFTVVLGRLAPTLIFPLFYEFEALADDHPLKERIGTLSSSVGLNVAGVFRFNLSKTTKKANAAFTGLGRAKRVLLSDTLLEQFPDDEILAVVAHELGHFKMRHIWKGMALGIVLTVVGLKLVASVHASITAGNVTDLATLPWLALLLGLYSFATAPLANAYSRRNEFAADGYSRRLLGSGRDLASGLQRLAELNLADRDPHPLVEFMFYNHPSITRRLVALAEDGGATPEVD